MALDLLHTIGHDLLLAASDALADGGLPVPNRQFVDTCNVIAPIAFGEDCESQLAVTCGDLSPATPPQFQSGARNAQGMCQMVWSAPYCLTLFRCFEPASDELPSPEALDEAARTHLLDGWQLARGLTYRWAHKTLLPSYANADCASISFRSMTCLAPQGGIRGWRLCLDVLVVDIYAVGELTPEDDLAP